MGFTKEKDIDPLKGEYFSSIKNSVRGLSNSHAIQFAMGETARAQQTDELALSREAQLLRIENSRLSLERGRFEIEDLRRKAKLKREGSQDMEDIRGKIDSIVGDDSISPIDKQDQILEIKSNNLDYLDADPAMRRFTDLAGKRVSLQVKKFEKTETLNRADKNRVQNLASQRAAAGDLDYIANYIRGKYPNEGEMSGTDRALIQMAKSARESNMAKNQAAAAKEQRTAEKSKLNKRSTRAEKNAKTYTNLLSEKRNPRYGQDGGDKNWYATKWEESAYPRIKGELKRLSKNRDKGVIDKAFEELEGKDLDDWITNTLESRISGLDNFWE